MSTLACLVASSYSRSWSRAWTAPSSLVVFCTQMVMDEICPRAGQSRLGASTSQRTCWGFQVVGLPAPPDWIGVPGVRHGLYSDLVTGFDGLTFPFSAAA